MRQGVLALGVLAFAGAPAAAEYPDRPVTVIHNYGPGTASDATARSLAEAFAAHFGRPFRW
jgi:tripartite-type tricarboxylate transporter receptor subunit TctC